MTSLSNNSQNNLKIFDLNDEKIKLSKNLQKNLKFLHKKFGKKFKIKYFDLECVVILEYISFDTNNFSFYRMKYYEKYSFDTLLPFKIDFYDIFEKKKNSNSYIAEIHKTYNISGSLMVKLVLAINKKLGVNKTFLYDSSSVICENDPTNKIDLSFLKYIQNGVGFYTKLGFSFDTNNQLSRLVPFDNPKQLLKKLDSIIIKIRKITISEVIKLYQEILDIINKIIKTQDYNGLDIILIDTVTIKPLASNDFVFITDPKIKIHELFNECDNVIRLLLKSDEKYLYKYMIKLATDKKLCEEYVKLVDNLCLNQIYKIKYKNKIVIKDFVVWFHYLFFIKNSFYLSYKFKN